MNKKAGIPLLALVLVIGVAACSQSSGTGPSPVAGVRAVTESGASSPLSATIQFGMPIAGSPFPPSADHDDSAHATDNLVPRTVVIAAGGTVTFDVPASAHQIAIYAPGTEPEDIDTTIRTPICPGTAPRLINDPANRVALITHACGSAWQAQYTFTTPGRYLVICAFLPHFQVGMWGWVEVKE
jgi:plastocyanin